MRDKAFVLPESTWLTRISRAHQPGMQYVIPGTEADQTDVGRSN